MGTEPLLGRCKRRLRAYWGKLSRTHWATSPHGLGYHHALDDVWGALDPHNPCHDRVRDWIVKRREELAP